MAMSAWRLMKMGIVVKQIKTVEALGGATVFCTDKTGTLTENNMRASKLFTLSTGTITDFSGALQPEEKQLVHIAMWGQ